MIIHTTLIRTRPGGKMVGMLGVMKYVGGDLSGITRALYKPSILYCLWYSIKFRKKVTHCASIFYDTDRLKEFRYELQKYGFSVIHKEFKYYNSMKAKLYLEDHEATILRIIA